MHPRKLTPFLAPAVLAGLLAGCGDDASSDWTPPVDGGGWQDGTSGADGSADAGHDGAMEAAIDAKSDAAQDASEPPADAAVDVAPDAPPPVEYSFVAFADNQFATASCTSGVPERLAIPKAILQLGAKFAIEAGDLMDHGYEDGSYEKLVSCYQDMIASIPFFPAPGNHDMSSSGLNKFKPFLEAQLQTRNPAAYGADYAKDFSVVYGDDPNTYSKNPSDPGPTTDVPSGFSWETFYAFRYANAYFLSFEQGTRWWTNTPKSWVEKHLKAARADSTIDHVFVYMHHPMYSSTMAETGDSECIAPVRKHYEALFRQYDVTVVFSGHAHFYDHFYVPDDGHATRGMASPYPHDGAGVHYMVTGGGGGPLPNSDCDPMPGEQQDVSHAFGQARGCGYHVTHVKVSGKKLAIDVVGVDGSESSFTTSTMDSFRIE